ncbi:MAG: hypothetical protein RLZZ283_105, partial [Candidatus Parcubacteria bacterium]
PTAAPEEGCNNPTNNQHTRDALEKYGSNLLDGNVPGLDKYCPNYANLSREQRIGFWTQFINSVQKPESGCRSNAFGPEPDLSRPSQGLMQLSYGDNPVCSKNRGACSSISVSVDNAETAAGLSSTDSRRAINDPRNNLMCAVGIMDCLATGGITSPDGRNNGYKGMDRYWSVLRDHRATDDVIRATALSYPGCQ